MDTPHVCEVSDDFWTKVEPLANVRENRPRQPFQRAPGAGRKPIDARKMLAVILHVLRHDLPWNAAPKFAGSVQTVHRHFRLLLRRGVFLKLHPTVFGDCPELAGIDWTRLELTRPVPPVTKVTQPAPVVEAREREPSVWDSRVQSQLMKLHGATNSSMLWSSLQSLFREAIPNNSMVAYLDYFDHPKTWMAAKILTTANADMPPEWFEKRWKLDITKPFIKSNPGIKFFRFSDIIADPMEFQSTDYFRHFFKPFGWYYTACLSYWHGTGINSVIALRRTREQGDYRPGEIELFKKLHPHIETVLKRLLPVNKEQTKAQWLGEFAQHVPLPLLLLDWKLEPIYVNREALEQCANWNFGPESARSLNPRAVFRVPDSVLQFCEAIRARWYDANRPGMGPATVKTADRLCHPSLPDFSATVTIQTDAKDLISKPGFLIYFDRREAARLPLSEVREKAALRRLTSTEKDLVQLASAGYSNKDIAVQLHKSVNTVKHQLTSVYSKLGINGRGKRLANSLGSSQLAVG